MKFARRGVDTDLIHILRHNVREADQVIATFIRRLATRSAIAA